MNRKRKRGRTGTVAVGCLRCMAGEGAFRGHGFGLDCTVRPLLLHSAMEGESGALGKLGWGLERGSGRHGASARGAT